LNLYWFRSPTDPTSNVNFPSRKIGSTLNNKNLYNSLSNYNTLLENINLNLALNI